MKASLNKTILFVIASRMKCCGGTNTNSNRNIVPSPFSQYLFEQDACLNSVFSDEVPRNTPTLNLIPREGNASFVCAPFLGVAGALPEKQRTTALVSEEPISSHWAVAESSNNGISVELWLRTPLQTDKLDVEVNQLHPIMTIGQRKSAHNPMAITRCDQDGYDLQIYQRSDMKIEVSFRTDDQFFEPCQRFHFDAKMEPGKLVHLVVSLEDRHQTIDINGQRSLVLAAPFANDLSHWNLEENGLHLFSYHPDDADASSETWGGTIYQVSFYDFPMAEQDVKNCLVQGLPATKPFAFNQTFTMNEDGESIPESHDYDWYFNEESRIDDAETIDGPHVGSLNHEVEDILSELGLRSNSLGSKPIYVYITGLPSRGTLYYANKAPIKAEMEDEDTLLIPVGTAPVKQLFYLPPFNDHSLSPLDTFTSFSYCVSREPIFDMTQCESSAEVNIIVLAVNDPPVAIDVSPISILEGVDVSKQSVEQRIPLHGLDTDLGDAIQVVEITQAPSYGSLTLNLPTFRKDSLRHGTSLSDLGNIVQGEDLVYVNYSTNQESPVTIVQGTSTRDFFKFRVQDKQGTWSTEKSVDIQIVSAVEAKVSESQVTIDEDSNEEGSLKWFGNDSSGSNRQVRYFVEKVPPEHVGVLIVPVSQQKLTAGTLIDAVTTYPYSQSINITFTPASDFCHAQTANSASDSEIRFLAVATKDDGKTVISASRPVSQNVRVACKIDSVSMDVPLNHVTTLETSLERSTYDACHGYHFDPKRHDENRSCDSAAIISGINVKSHDLKAKRATVVVKTMSGFITFNKHFWGHVEPISGRRSMAAGNVTFSAYPEDLNKILTDLHYSSYTPGNDTIEIELRYGNCSDYELSGEAKWSPTPSCQVIRKQIKVEVKKDSAKYETETMIVVGFPWQVAFCIVGYPLVYLALTYLQKGVSNDDDEITIVLGSPECPLERWIQHMADNGMFYYENTQDGSVTWQAPPPEEDFIRYCE